LLKIGFTKVDKWDFDEMETPDLYDFRHRLEESICIEASK